MTDKEVQQLLLTHYEWVMAQVQKLDDIQEIHRLLRTTHTARGVCYCAQKMFNAYIYFSPWTTSSGSIIWGAFPQNAVDKDKAIELLQVRIDKLKILVNESK